MAKKQQKALQGHKTPPGVLGKGKRIAAQPLGYPAGHHDPKNKACQCGRCSTR